MYDALPGGMTCVTCDSCFKMPQAKEALSRNFLNSFASHTSLVVSPTRSWKTSVSTSHTHSMEGSTSSLHTSSPPKSQRWAATHQKTKSDTVWSESRNKMPAEENNKAAIRGVEDNNSLRADRTGVLSCDNMGNKNADKRLLQDFDLPNFEHPCSCSPDGKAPRTSRRSRKKSNSCHETPECHSSTRQQSIAKSYKPSQSVEMATSISIPPPKAPKDRSARNNDSSIHTIDLEDLYQEAIQADIERKKQQKSEVEHSSNSKKGERNSGRPAPYVRSSLTVADGMTEDSFILHGDESAAEIPEHMAQLEQEREMIELALQRSMQDSQSIIATTKTTGPSNRRRQPGHLGSATAPSTTTRAESSLDTSRREGETEEERLDRLDREMLELALQQSRSDCTGQF